MVCRVLNRRPIAAGRPPEQKQNAAREQVHSWIVASRVSRRADRIFSDFGSGVGGQERDRGRGGVGARSESERKPPLGPGTRVRATGPKVALCNGHHSSCSHCHPKHQRKHHRWRAPFLPRLSCHAAHHRWTGYCEQAGVEIDIHQLRHTHATGYNGISIEADAVLGLTPASSASAATPPTRLPTRPSRSTPATTGQDLRDRPGPRACPHWARLRRRSAVAATLSCCRIDDDRRPGKFFQEVREGVSDRGGGVRSRGEAAHKGRR